MCLTASMIKFVFQRGLMNHKNSFSSPSCWQHHWPGNRVTHFVVQSLAVTPSGSIQPCGLWKGKVDCEGCLFKGMEGAIFLSFSFSAEE